MNIGSLDLYHVISVGRKPAITIIDYNEGNSNNEIESQ